MCQLEKYVSDVVVYVVVVDESLSTSQLAMIMRKSNHSLTKNVGFKPYVETQRWR
jgi:hypothetical protein